MDSYPYIFYLYLLTIESRCDEYNDCFDESDEVGCEHVRDNGWINSTLYEDLVDEDYFLDEDDYASYFDYPSNDTIDGDV